MATWNKKEKPEKSHRIITVYVSLIAVAALFFVFLSIRSIAGQWRVLLFSSDADLQRAGQGLVSDLETRTIERASSYLADSELSQISTLSEALPDPRAARQIRNTFERVAKRHPIGKYPFIVRNGTVEFPVLRAVAAESPLSVIRREQGDGAAKFATLFQSAESQNAGTRCPATALKSYSQAYELPVSERLKALALAGMADCYRDQKQFSTAEARYRELAEKHADDYDVDGTPYPLVAVFAMDRFGAAAPADIHDQLVKLYDDLIGGRWELNAPLFEKLQTDFRHRLGNELGDKPTEFLAHMQSAEALQSALRRKADPELLYRVNGDPASQVARAGDVFAFAYADRANSYQSFYSVLAQQPNKQTLLGFTVDMDWLQREILPEVGVAGA